MFCPPASPRGSHQRSGAAGEEEGESEGAGGAEDSDQTAGGGETTQRGEAPPTGPLRQVDTDTPADTPAQGGSDERTLLSSRMETKNHLEEKTFQYTRTKNR